MPKEREAPNQVGFHPNSVATLHDCFASLKILKDVFANSLVFVCVASLSAARTKSNLLSLSSEELNASLSRFVREVCRPNGERYSPDSILYLCLGIQQVGTKPES